MVETVFNFTVGNEKMAEKVVDDEHLGVNHVVLNKGEALPLHFANSNAYLSILRGKLTLQFNDGEINHYDFGHIVGVPYKTKMNVSNTHDETVEFFVIKSPNPRHYEK